MKQRPANASGHLLSTPLISPNAFRPRKLRSLLATLTVLILSMAAGDTADARYNKLGHRMICMCISEPAAGMGGRSRCQQILLECTHADCDVSPRMQHELRAGLQTGDSDDAILNSFVRKYGAEVLEHSRTASNKLIWVVALALLTSAIIASARKWKSRPAVVATAPELHGGDVDGFRDRVRRETETDDWL